MRNKKDIKNIEDDFNYTILPYVIADERKAKFLPYVRCEEFYKLNYNLKNKAIAIISGDTLLKRRENGLVSLCNDNVNTYYYRFLDDSYNFSIIYVESIENVMEEKNVRY